MIYCPKCGTANRRGSRFCNECGEPLPMRTALRCPMCGTMNPVGNVYCDRCNARLIPMTLPLSGESEREQAPIKGLSLPTIPLEEDREQHVDIAERADEEKEEVEEAAEDWLAQLRASTEEEKGEEEEEEEKGEGEERAEKPEVIAESIEPVEFPDWLRDIGPIGVEAKATPDEGQPAVEAPLEEEAPTMPPPTPAGIPDWLQEIAPPEAAAPETAPPAAETAPEEPAPEIPALAPAGIPDWLQEIAPPEAATPEAAPPAAETAPEEPAPEIPALAPAEIPDWLQEIAPPEAAAPEAAPPAAETAPEEPAPEIPAPVPAEIPDWLQEIAPPEAAAPEAAPPAAETAPEKLAPEIPAPVPAEIPDWLQKIAPPEAAAPEVVLPAAEIMPAEAPTEETAPPPPLPFIGTPPPIVAEIPEWLREIAPEEEAIPEAAPPAPPAVEFPTEAETIEAPEWLAELQAEPAPPSAPSVPAFEGVTPSLPPEPGIGMAEVEGLARAEIPDWLKALRPRPEAAEAAAEEEAVETEGPLQGLRGVLPPAPAIEVPPVRESTLPAGVSEASLARAQLLQNLLARPAEMPRPEVRKRGVSIGERIQRWLVAAVLLVAIGGMLIPPLVGFNIPTLTQPTTPPGAIRLYNVAQGVSAGDTILVAFEYGPPEADELNLVAEPILRHLLDQGARISVVSTQPEGLTVAAGLLSDIVASEERYTEKQYTLVGYRPGGATGVSQLLTNLYIPHKGETEGDTHPRLILVLTAQPAPLRWWVEQTRALGDMYSIVAGVSAALEPAASPYLDASAGQLEGTINGLSGAAAYEARRGLGGRATQRTNTLAAGHVAVVGLMILGAVFYAVGGLRRGGR